MKGKTKLRNNKSQDLRPKLFIQQRLCVRDNIFVQSFSRKEDTSSLGRFNVEQFVLL